MRNLQEIACLRVEKSTLYRKISSMSWSIQRLLSAKIRCGRLELRRIKKKKKTPKSLWDNVRTDIEKVGPTMSDRQDPVWVIVLTTTKNFH